MVVYGKSQKECSMNTNNQHQAIAIKNEVASNTENPPHTSIYTVDQFSNRNPAFTTSSLRNLIHKANRRKSSIGDIEGNGLIEAGALLRIGRKVLIHEPRFFNWLDLQQNREA